MNNSSFTTLTMFCSRYVRVCLLLMAISVPSTHTAIAQINGPDNQSHTTVSLRWGRRAGVFRYRLQLARDPEFADIVFDRIVAGNEIQVADLAPGKYFWRVAALTTKTGSFSSVGAMEVRAVQPILTGPQSETGSRPEVRRSAVTATGGWRAAIGEAGVPVPARLRAPGRLDLVVTNSAGVTYALDAMSGVPLWIFRLAGARAPLPVLHAPVAIATPSGLDNVILAAETDVVCVEGTKGRELWRARVPSVAAITTAGDPSAASIIIVDRTLQKLSFLDPANGKFLAEVLLPGRIIGKPVAFNDRGRAAFVLAYDRGDVEVRDQRGVLIRAGSAQSPATTAPAVAHTTGGDLILVGTQDGLAAINGDTLQFVGRLSLNGDLPRGFLTVRDLDGNGVPEALMTTARGRVVAVDAAQGKILWELTARNEASTFAFADLNGDRVLDVVVPDGQALLAVSGHDGSILWTDTQTSNPVANHAAPARPRTIAVIGDPANSALIVTSEPARGGVRAVQVRPAVFRPATP